MALKNSYPFELIPTSRNDWDMAKEPEKAGELIEHYKPDVIINPAAYTDVDGAEDDPETATKVNASAVGELAKSCNKANIPLLHVSTDYVFDGAKEAPYTEDDPINPINVYGKSKADGEQLIRELLKEHIILRTSWVFSKEGKNFVNTMRQLGKEREELIVVNDQRGQPTPADCIAKALLDITGRILFTDQISWGTYHYAGMPAVSWYEFAQFIFQNESEIKRPKLTPCFSSEYQTRAARPKNSVMSTALIKKMGILDCYWKNEIKFS